MEVHLKWKRMNSRSSDFNRVLYSYVDHSDDQILYIGKADFCSVRQRMRGEHKRGLYEYFDEINVKKFNVIIGEFYLEENRRLSQELISDSESLLIKRLQPPGNIMSRSSRIMRPGLKVLCFGNWPHHRANFFDR
jgi:hypothetical protein